VTGEKIPTKREILGLVMSVYDPLGFLGYLTVKAKIILQDIWRSGVGWDDEVVGPILEKWKMWLSELKLISNQLHVFCDASEQAYCVVAYLRSCTQNGVETAFISFKTHVAPLKSISIPRL
jgi:hypothetical protein